MIEKYITHLFTIVLLSFFLITVPSCNQNSQETEADTDSSDDSTEEWIYVGTFDGRDSQGLYVFEFDRETLEFTERQTLSDRESPNFQALHPSGEYLYSVSNEAFSGQTGHGTLTAYRIEDQTGMLSRLNEQSTGGRGAAHVSVDPQGRFVYVSNYSGGNLSVFAIGEDGQVSEAVDVVEHEGSSINEHRQNAPHVHSVIPSVDGRFIYVSDLGIDRIMIYEVNPSTGELRTADNPYVQNTPGAGPRHFTFHPNGQFAYSLEELTSTVAVFDVDPETGGLIKSQRVDMLPEEFDGDNTAADIHMSPDGRFLYASNRGHDSLVIYEVDPDNGQLHYVEHEGTRGAHPRNFLIDHTGNYVFVANRDADNIVIFERDKETGQLNYTGNQIQVPMVVCITQLVK